MFVFTQYKFTANNATDMAILDKHLACNTFIFVCMLSQIRE
jgi:hypothetical protein